MTSHNLDIIIVSYNTVKLTRRCILSLRSEAQQLAAQIIVVDNRSSDESVAMIREEFPGVRLLPLDGNMGFGAANNRAVALSRARYLLLLNSDTIVQPGTLQSLLTFAEAHPDAGAVGPRLIGPDGNLQQSCWRFPTPWDALAESLGLLRLLRRPSNYLPSDYSRAMMVDFAVGACLLVRRDMFLEVGGFDERFFMYAEETDLCRRMRDCGKRVYYTPDSTAVHLGGGSKTTTAQQLVQFHTSRDLYFRKHFGPGWLQAYHVASILNCLIRLPLWRFAQAVRHDRRSLLEARITKLRWIMKWHLARLDFTERAGLASGGISNQ